MISKFGILVMVTAGNIVSEGDVDMNDFKGDDFMVAARVNAVREVVTSDPNYDPRMENVLKAMEMAGLTVKQGARFFAALTMLDNQKKGH